MFQGAIHISFSTYKFDEFISENESRWKKIKILNKKNLKVKYYSLIELNDWLNRQFWGKVKRCWMERIRKNLKGSMTHISERNSRITWWKYGGNLRKFKKVRLSCQIIEENLKNVSREFKEKFKSKWKKN